MEPAVLFTVLRHQESYLFQLQIPSRMPGWAQSAHNPVVLADTVTFTPELHQQLQQAIDTAVQTLRIFYPLSNQSITPAEVGTDRSMERLGRLLFSLLPKSFQDAIPLLPPGSSLHLVTNDGELPWELLHGKDGFLSLRLAIGRQLLLPVTAQAESPPGKPARSFLFISNPTGDLDAADAEVVALMDGFDSHTERIKTKFLCRQQVTRLAVREELASGHYDVIHYSGHATPGTLILADGELTAVEIQQSLHGRPFIYLNACYSARTAGEVTPTDGLPGFIVRNLASAFLLGGAMGFMGTLWPVFDTTSRLFAERFYAYARAGKPVGETLRLVREQTFPDPLWASFIYYGDPRLKIAGLERYETHPVTALALRFAGLRPLLNSMPLETATQLETHLLDLCTQAALPYGGAIYQCFGDFVTLHFGLPQAHEDDAERAIRATLAISHRWRTFQEQAIKALPDQVTLHTGVSSGLITVRYQADRPLPVVMGPVMDTAVALATNAAAEQIVVDRLTYDSSQSHFGFQPVDPPPTLLSAVMPAYRFLSLRADATPVTPLIGREEQLGQLLGWWQEVCRGQARIVSLIGAAGTGKTHLTQTFQAMLADQPHRWLAANGRSYDQTTPYALLGQIVAGLADILPDDDEADRQRKCEMLLQQTLNQAAAPPTYRAQGLALLAEMLGLPYSLPAIKNLDPELRQRRLAALLQVVLSQQAQPLVLCLEDIHWADEASLNVLNQMMGGMEKTAVLLLATYRPEWSPGWGHWPQHRQLTLGELDEITQYALLATRLDGKLFPEPLAEFLLARAGGSPLFLQELVSSLQEQGILILTRDTWVLTADLDSLAMPDRLEQIILGRLDHLSVSARLALQLAAAIGPVFSHHMLGGIQDAVHRLALDRSLQELKQQGLVHDLGGFWPDVAYAFRHVLIQQVIYDHLPERPRRAYHRLIAQQVQRLFPVDEEKLEIIAHHYVHSDDRVQAVRFSLRAAGRAANAWANQTALLWYGRVLHLLESLATDPNQLLVWQIEALYGQCQVQLTIGQYDAAILSCQQAIALLNQTTNMSATRLAEGYQLLAMVYHHQGLFWEGLTAVETGLALFDAQPGVVTARLHLWAGIIHYRLRHFNEALAASGRAIVLMGESPDTKDLAQAYNLQGILYRHQGNGPQTIAVLAQSIALYQEVSYLPGLEKAYTNLGCVYQDIGQWADALHYFQQSAELSEQTGEERRRLAAHINLAEIYYLQGQLVQAIQTCQAATHLAHRFNLPEYHLLSMMISGKAYLKRGEWEGATIYLEDSLKLCDQLQSDLYRPEILRCLAELQLQTGQLEAARTYATDALEMTVKEESREQGAAYRTLAIVNRAQGELEVAGKLLVQGQDFSLRQQNVYEIALTLVEWAHLYLALLKADNSREIERANGFKCGVAAVQLLYDLGATADLPQAREVVQLLSQ